jgi:hypothetical protein
MWRNLFLSIMHKLSKISPYFSERYDATMVLASLRCKVYRYCASISLWHGRRYDR